MKLKMLRGLPASGKTTAARQMVKEGGNLGRINRDDLRAMLFDSVWTGKREGIVVDCEKAIAEVLLKHSYTPVVDDTNLTDKHLQMWKGFAKDKEATFETVDMGQDLQTCIQRDSKRERQVGPAVITKLALIGGLIPWLSGTHTMVIVDIDGTLTDGVHREHFVQSTPKNWDAYYARLSEDKPIDLVVRWVNKLVLDYIVVLVSGRPDTYQHETVTWLKKHRISYDYLLMRGGGDKRPDTQVKADILKLLPKEKIAMVIDDRPSVIEMWKSHGLKVIPVRGGCEPF